jgi:PilZ domain
MKRSDNQIAPEDVLPPRRSRVGLGGTRRRHKRVDAGEPVLLITVADRINGLLKDLSQSGARVALRGKAPAPGRDVLLRWGTHEMFGQVVWSVSTELGVAFHKTISKHVLAEAIGLEVSVEVLPELRML